MLLPIVSAEKTILSRTISKRVRCRCYCQTDLIILIWLYEQSSQLVYFLLLFFGQYLVFWDEFLFVLAVVGLFAEKVVYFSSSTPWAPVDKKTFTSLVFPDIRWYWNDWCSQVSKDYTVRRRYIFIGFTPVRVHAMALDGCIIRASIRSNVNSKIWSLSNLRCPLVELNTWRIWVLNPRPTAIACLVVRVPVLELLEWYN